jgi:hypothetical protein
MALATSVTGDGKLVTASKTQRNLRDAGEDFYNRIETIENEVREWVALTKDAAITAKGAGTGESSMTLSGPGVTYENSATEDNRIVGAYTYRVSAEKKTIAFAE